MKLPRAKVRKRPGIGWASALLVFGMFAFGFFWMVFYYGVIVPISSAMTGSFPWAFDSLSLAFMNAVLGFWPFIILMFYLLWLWMQSNKQGLHF